MAKVIPLSDARRARDERLAAALPPTAEELEERIDAYCGGNRLPSGAVRLLFAIAKANRAGRVELSSSALAKALGLSRRSIVSYISALEDHYLIKVRRARINKIAAVNKIEIDFSGPLGESVSCLKMPRQRLFGSATLAPSRPNKELGVVQTLRSKDESLKEETNNLKVIGRAARPQYETAEDAINAGCKKVRAAREVRVLKPASQLTLAGVKAT